MLYSISKCFDMLDFNAYDVIFRCRTEIKYREKINEEHLNLAINGNLIIPHGLDSGGYQDSFAFSSPDQMSIYSSLYRYIEKYSERGQNVHPESMLKHHLTINPAKVQRIKFPMMLRGGDYID
jgi:hypothetical protein